MIKLYSVNSEYTNASTKICEETSLLHLILSSETYGLKNYMFTFLFKYNKFGFVYVV
jgi:hypothetical protein